MATTLLIAGCGYLGKQLAQQARELGLMPVCLTKSPSHAAALEADGFRARACDLASAPGLKEMAGWLNDDAPLIAHCAASGRGGSAEEYRSVYLEGCRNLLSAFPQCRRFFFASSSSVYAQIDGSLVNEDSPAEPERETGRILRDAEDLVLAGGRGIAGRLAGIYGPGRSVLLRQFLTGESRIDVRTEPPATPDGRWINQIHRDDAARAILHLLTLPDAEKVTGRVFNVADSTPLLQRPLYTELAQRFHRSVPPEGPPDVSRKRGWTHKRVSNALLLSTGWTLRFTSWLDALDGDPELVPSILNEIGI